MGQEETGRLSWLNMRGQGKGQRKKNGLVGKAPRRRGEGVYRKKISAGLRRPVVHTPGFHLIRK